MDIYKLALLSDIADTKNLTISAERMGYTQSGVSHAINKLELEMGLCLLVRTNRGVELTKDASLLLPKIRNVITHYNRLTEDVNSLHGLQRGSVCVGTYSSIARHWLPAAIQSFHQMYPNIQINIREGGSEELEAWLYAGSIDFAFLSWRKQQQFKFITIARDPLYAVTSKSFPLPTEYSTCFPVSAFADYPFIASDRGVDSDVAGVLEDASVKPVTSFYCRDDHTIIPMVRNNLGISLLPGLFIEDYEKDIQKIPLSPNVVRTLGIGVISEKHLSVSAETFIKISKLAIKKLLG